VFCQLPDRNLFLENSQAASVREFMQSLPETMRT
jgi:hypothetical protein